MHKIKHWLIYCAMHDAMSAMNVQFSISQFFRLVKLDPTLLH